ncbi:hypothetical protein IMG5_175090 [Ichthyophthirius multifiliis]|uniref:Uncharacterized protein n=1 Tax=Ichthyophthirius multifiliis TaxID=5932 RepID=G0R253_ICHMU|nr:hypothetical protein IMG5_175090 [Ichthyophthirius multifiliis]EGR28460.1 hypothetical protein IMG5_175090 [Ichthyophthirius multifiliis]|eukprot:XP_004029696.1 hypothetical protein IMG5_175090 [Ichthyophthirius multifiliis]
MDLKDQQEYQQKLKELEQDDEEQWWRAGQNDQFDLNKKLFRVGCRPAYRKFIECDKQYDDKDIITCDELKQDLQKCLAMLKYFYGTTEM